MKRYQMIVLIVSMYACIAQAVSSLSAAEIIYTEGSVQVQGGQEDSWRAAERGTKVDIGDKVRTARNSRADVALDDEKKNTVRIESKTLVVLNSANPGLIDKLDLSHGKVYAKVENIKAGLSFEVATPSSVAGVRGSAYSVYAERDSDEIQAYKDSAFVQAYDSDGKLITELTLPEGFKTFVERFEAPGALIQVSLREFSRFDNISEDLTAHEQGNMQSRRQREEKEAQEQKKAQSELTQDVSQQSQILEAVSSVKEQDKENTLDNAIETTRTDSHCEIYE